MADHMAQGNAPLSKTSTAPMATVSPNAINRATFPLQSAWVQRLVTSNNESLLFDCKSSSVENEICVEGSQQNVVPQKCKQAINDFVESGRRSKLSRYSSQLGDTEKEEEEPDKCGNHNIEFSCSLLMSDDREFRGSIQKQQDIGGGHLKENRDLDTMHVMSGGETSTIPLVRTSKFQSRGILAKQQNSSLVIEHSGQLSALNSSVMISSEQQSLSPLQKNSKLEVFSGVETQKRKIEVTSCGIPANGVSAISTIHRSTRKPPLPRGTETRTKVGIGIPLKSHKFQAHGNSPLHPGFLPSSSGVTKKILVSEGTYVSDCTKAPVLEQRGKALQHSKYFMTDNFHCQQFFEEEGKNSQEFTTGESLSRDDESDMQAATKPNLQHGLGLLSATPAPIFQGGESDVLPATSLTRTAPRNLTKTLNQRPVYFKSSKIDFAQGGQEHGIGESSTSEKSQVNVSRQWTNLLPVHSTQNLQELKMQASSASPTTNLSRGTLIKAYYKSQCHVWPQDQGDQVASGRINQMSTNSSNLVYLQSASNASEVQSPKSFQLPSTSGIQQLPCNFDKMEKQIDLIKVDVCKLGAKVEGTNLGPVRKAVLSLQDKESSSSGTESFHLEESQQPLTTESQRSNGNPKWAKRSCLDLVLEDRWAKRCRPTPCSNEKMVQSLGSDKVVDASWQIGQILGQGIGSEGNRGLEAVHSYCAAELTEVSEDALKCNRINAYGHGAGRPHNVPLCMPNQGDRSPSCLGKRPYCIDHVGGTRLFNYTGLVCNSMEQNVTGSIKPCLENRSLQTGGGPSDKVVSFCSQQKADMTSLSSNPWIHHWCPSFQIASSPDEIHCLPVAYGGINPKRFKQKHPCEQEYPVKLLPSAAAMAIVGLAMQNLRPCVRQKKGSLLVWTVVGSQ